MQSVPGITLGRESGALEIIGGCSNISSLPNITFALGTGNFSLTPQQYIVQVQPKVGLNSLMLVPSSALKGPQWTGVYWWLGRLGQRGHVRWHFSLGR